MPGCVFDAESVLTGPQSSPIKFPLSRSLCDKMGYYSHFIQHVVEDYYSISSFVNRRRRRLILEEQADSYKEWFPNSSCSLLGFFDECKREFLKSADHITTNVCHQNSRRAPVVRARATKINPVDRRCTRSLQHTGSTQEQNYSSIALIRCRKTLGNRKCPKSKPTEIYPQSSSTPPHSSSKGSPTIHSSTKCQQGYSSQGHSLQEEREQEQEQEVPTPRRQKNTECREGYSLDDERTEHRQSYFLDEEPSAPRKGTKRQQGYDDGPSSLIQRGTERWQACLLDEQPSAPRQKTECWQGYFVDEELSFPRRSKRLQAYSLDKESSAPRLQPSTRSQRGFYHLDEETSSPRSSTCINTTFRSYCNHRFSRRRLEFIRLPRRPHFWNPRHSETHPTHPVRSPPPHGPFTCEKPTADAPTISPTTGGANLPQLLGGKAQAARVECSGRSCWLWLAQDKIRGFRKCHEGLQ